MKFTSFHQLLFDLGMNPFKIRPEECLKDYKVEINECARHGYRFVALIRRSSQEHSGSSADFI